MSQSSNLMAVLALAWCYVLSAKWLEAQPAATPKMAYTELKPPTKSKADNVPTFQIRTGFNDPVGYNGFPQY